jgi:hypothetical protein
MRILRFRIRIPNTSIKFTIFLYIQAMEVDTRPTEQYSDIGGLDKQIQELVEAVVLPMTHKDRFVNLGIKPPKAGLQKTPAQWVFVFFCFFSGFLVFFWFFGLFRVFWGVFWVFIYIYLPRSEVFFRVFFSFKNTFRCIQTLNYNHSY